MSKQRKSFCKEENAELLEALRDRVENFKQKPVKQKVVKQQSDRSSVKSSHLRTPKKLVCLKLEAKYASVPAREKSELLEFVIRKEVENFKKVPQSSRKKTKIAAVNWYHGPINQGKENNTNKCNKNL